MHGHSLESMVGEEAAAAYRKNLPFISDSGSHTPEELQMSGAREEELPGGLRSTTFRVHPTPAFSSPVSSNQCMFAPW